MTIICIDGFWYIWFGKKVIPFWQLIWSQGLSIISYLVTVLPTSYLVIIYETNSKKSFILRISRVDKCNAKFSTWHIFMLYQGHTGSDIFVFLPLVLFTYVHNAHCIACSLLFILKSGNGSATHLIFFWQLQIKRKSS